MEHRAAIAAVGKQLLEEGKLSEQGGQYQHTAVAVLHIGGGNQGVQQQAQRVYKDVALLATDELAAVKPGRIDMDPPCMGFMVSSVFLLRAPAFAAQDRD